MIKVAGREWETSHKEAQFLNTRFLRMEGSNSYRNNCLSPQIDLYLVKVSKICLILAVRNLTLSTRVEEDEYVVFLLALVLNFLPTLGVISKIKEKKNQQQQKTKRRLHQIELKHKITWNFENYMMHDAKTHIMHDLMYKNS